jgi:hypothetical protein
MMTGWVRCPSCRSIFELIVTSEEELSPAAESGHPVLAGATEIDEDGRRRVLDAAVHAARLRADAEEIARLRAVVDAARVVYAMLDESCANGAEADALGSALAALDAKEDR